MNKVNINSVNLNGELTAQDLYTPGTEIIKPEHLPPYDGAKPYSLLTRIAPLLHDIKYDTLDYEKAYAYFEGGASVDTVGACSAIRFGDSFGRNYDWFAPKDHATAQAEFVVTTPKTENYKAVKGIATMAGLTEDVVEKRTDSELWDILPFCLTDGFNGSLFACVNVVPSDKGNTTASVPTSTLEQEVCSTMLVRYVLDRFDDAQEACEYIKQHVSVFFSESLKDLHYDAHYMIGDAQHTYILEFINNAVVYHEGDKMTNFYIDGVTFLPNGKVYTNADVPDGNLPSSLGVSPHGAGLERFNSLVDGNDSMRALMNGLLYSNAYDLDHVPFWYSEYVGSSDGYDVTVDTEPSDSTMQAAIEAAQEIKRGEREGNLWMTTHSVVYDLKSGDMNIVSFEDTANPILIGASNSLNEKIDKNKAEQDAINIATKSELKDIVDVIHAMIDGLGLQTIPFEYNGMRYADTTVLPNTTSIYNAISDFVELFDEFDYQVEMRNSD